MSKLFDHLNEKLQDFIKKQHLFFVATAASEGRVNLSPKGGDFFRIINKNKIVWLNLTGSGNETAGHLLKDKRMTIMFCSFNEKPLILRLYGTAKIYHKKDNEFNTYSNLFKEHVGTRQIIEMEVDLVQTSCGYAVPKMDFVEDRDLLDKWSNNKGEEGIAKYWEEKNMKSIDGFETKII